MRLSDGFVLENEAGLVIETRTDKYVSAVFIPWDFIFWANCENRLNEMLTSRIEFAQKELKRYQEAADDREKTEDI